MCDIRRNVPIEVKNRKSDKTVFEYRDKPMRGNYSVDDVDQLITYMSSIKFPYGIGTVSINSDGVVNDIVDEVDNLTGFIKKACLNQHLPLI